MTDEIIDMSMAFPAEQDGLDLSQVKYDLRADRFSGSAYVEIARRGSHDIPTVYEALALTKWLKRYWGDKAEAYFASPHVFEGVWTSGDPEPAFPGLEVARYLQETVTVDIQPYGGMAADIFAEKTESSVETYLALQRIKVEYHLRERVIELLTGGRDPGRLNAYMFAQEMRWYGEEMWWDTLDPRKICWETVYFYLGGKNDQMVENEGEDYINLRLEQIVD